MNSLALPAAVTLKQAGAVLRDVKQAVADAQGSLRLDASALTDVDTSAVALLLHARRLAAARGLGFELQSVPPKLTALAQLYGVESLLADAAGAAA